jgi:phosphatidylglycerol lysyltransferase
VIKRLILLLLCINTAVLSFFYLFNIAPSRREEKISQAELHDGPVTIQLRNRPFTVFAYPAAKSPPLAVVLFASGDGGWNHWEDSVAHALQANGFTVMGINSADYAKTDYNLAILQADYDTIAQTVLSAYPNSPPPVIIGGWSMGGAQAIAVAGGPNPPRGLVGIRVASALSRGRYGLRVSDQLDVVPTGPGTFGVADFTSGVNGLRIVQWHGVGETLDSVAWLSNLRTPHREIDVPNGGHDFNDASPEFRRQVVENAFWILQSSF